MIGQHAIVIGASMAGLLAARVLSEHYERVTIIERDRLEGIDARKGVPQGRQTHALLSKGAAVIEQLFPDLFPALLEGGAIPVDMGADLHWYQFGVWRVQFSSGIGAYCQSRPWLEAQIRQRVAQRSNVHILDGYEVTRLQASADTRRITGVQVRSAQGERRVEEMLADLVVDASGRGSQTPQWLKALSYPQVEEAVVKVDVGYATRLYRRPKQAPGNWKVLTVYCSPPREKRVGFLIPIEGDRWTVSLSGWLKDYPPGDEAGFLEYMRSLPNPALYDLIKDAEPLTPIATYRFAANRRRYYERMSRFPEGLVVLGDALCSFNPIYGQGMTVAAIEVERLQTCLQQQERRQGKLAGFSRRFQKAIAGIVSAAWMFTTSEDFRYPETEGKRPFGMSLLHWYSRRLLEATSENRRLSLRFYQVMHMLKPSAALFTPAVFAAVLFRKRIVQPAQDRSPAQVSSLNGAEKNAAAVGTGAVVDQMNEPLVKKLTANDLSLPGLAATPDLLTRQLAPTTLRVPIKVELWPAEGARKRARVTPGIEGFSVFELIADEGSSFPQGTDSAPAPLDYFAAGAAFCLASHITLLSNQKHLQVHQFKMESELCFGLSPEGLWQCLGLRTLVDIDSDEPAERIRELVSEAKGLCLAEVVLAHPVPIQTSMSIRGTLLEADVPPTYVTPARPADADTIFQDR